MIIKTIITVNESISKKKFYFKRPATKPEDWKVFISSYYLLHFEQIGSTAEILPSETNKVDALTD
jgi:hypothetical protein